MASDQVLDQGLWNSGIALCGRAGEWQRACELLLQMPSHKLEPSREDFNAAIAACATSGQWESALQLLADMLAVQGKPNEITCLEGYMNPSGCKCSICR